MDLTILLNHLIKNGLNIYNITIYKNKIYKIEYDSNICLLRIYTDFNIIRILTKKIIMYDNKPVLIIPLHDYLSRNIGKKRSRRRWKL